MQKITTLTFTCASLLLFALPVTSKAQVAFTRETFAPFIEGLPVFNDAFDRSIDEAQTITFDSGVVSTNDIAFPLGLGRNEVNFDGRYENVIDGNGNNGPSRITWTFPEPITRVGFDYFGVEEGALSILVSLNGGQPDQIDLFEFAGRKSDGFIGLLGSQPYNEIAFISRRTRTNPFEIDNLTFSTLPENIRPLVWQGLSFSYDANFNWAPRRPPETFDSIVFGDTAIQKNVPLGNNRSVVAATFDGPTPYTVNDNDPNITLTAAEAIRVTASGASHTITGGVSTPLIDVAADSNLVLAGSIFGSNVTTKRGAGRLQLGSDLPRVTQPLNASLTLAEGTLALGSSNALGLSNIIVDGRVRLVEDFDTSAGPFTLNGTAALNSGSLLLTPASFFQQGSAVTTDLISSTSVERFEASFDVEIGGGNGADGLSFSLIDGLYSDTVPQGELGQDSDALTISFDTFENFGDPGDNVVRLRYDGQDIATAVPSFNLDGSSPFRAFASFDGTGISLRLRPEGGLTETLFSNVPIPGLGQTTSRLSFGARTSERTNEHLVDNLFFVADVGAMPTIEYTRGIDIQNSLLLSSDVELFVQDGTATQSGFIQGNTGVSSGGARVIKTGTGTLILNGANGYNGDTTIAEGLLLVENPSDSATGTGNVFVSSDGTLGGNGSVSGIVFVDPGGIVSPGFSPGILTVGGIDFNVGSELLVEIAGVFPGAEYDQLIVNGDLNLTDATLNLSLLNNFTPDFGQVFDIVQVDGNLNGQFLNLAEGDLIGSFDGIELFITYAAGDGNDIALFSAVPEPSSAVLVGMLVLVGLACIRRTRN